MTLLFKLAKPLLYRMDPENAHNLTINALKRFGPRSPVADDPRLGVSLFGLNFSNPLGLAAGFDKNAEVPDAMLGLGFGFVECGTVTPLPQEGNKRPRLFRLATDEAVINRFGFNNHGHDIVLDRLKQRAGKPGLVGINVGANKDTTDRVSDYVKGIRAFASLADYFTVNISSPNTPGLRTMQNREILDDLLAWSLHERDEAARHGPKRPLFLKIAPDLSLEELDDVVDVSRKRGIDALIVSNTTVKRPKSLHDKRMRLETGGLSGKPLYPLSTKMLSEAYLRVENQFPLIGVGGIDSARAAIGKIEAGASLIQLYSALVYKGPALINEIKKGLVARLVKDGLTSPLALVGRAVEDWKNWPIESFL